MLGGVKFIPRDQSHHEKKRNSRKKKHKRTKKSYDDSSNSEDGLESLKKRSRKKKWYTSDENSSSGSDSEDNMENSEDKHRNKKKKRVISRKKEIANEVTDVRKEMGLEWMLRPGENLEKKSAIYIQDKSEEASNEEVEKSNPKELNPYLKNNGIGYPEEQYKTTVGQDKLLPSSVVGDGGASWRLKALKRAQEQAAREGLKLESVVEERWDSLCQLTVSAASHKAAPSRSHLHATKNRQRGLAKERETDGENKSERNNYQASSRDYLRDVSLRHPDMRAPKVHDSLSWGKRNVQSLCADAGVIATALSSINKFANDGNFLSGVLHHKSEGPNSSDGCEGKLEAKLPLETRLSEEVYGDKEVLSANQLAAKALQLRMKGKNEEAEKLLIEAGNMKTKQGSADTVNRLRNEDSRGRYAMGNKSFQKRKEDDDGDRNLAKRIMENKQYNLSGQADDEYDFEDGPSRKSRKKGGHHHNVSQPNNFAKRIMTQQERCLFCFENPNRPKHLVVSIANFTYLMLPQRQPVVPGHCCILPLQHESATRTVDNNVWDEIRNFKKCLIMMFANQDKELVFLETVMELAHQRRHCLIECIPLPREVVKQAPLYFKKAIDEAEDEWSTHNAKRLIDTGEKGLRGSIPKNFPYFHVEFGLNKGFVHVIDDEKEFKSNLGLNVIRGMLQLPEEDMYRQARYESVEAQKQAVASFVQDWRQYDWTKQLD